MALALVALMSFEAVDLLFISQLGTVPLAAVSLTFPVIALMTGIGIGFEAGAASCVSRAVGKKKPHLAKRLTTDSVVVAGIATLCVSILGLLTIDPLFRLLRGDQQLFADFKTYLSIWYWVEPIAIMLWTALAAIRARGHAPLESKLIICAALINLILDPLLIFGLWGFPRLEVAGAAIASLIANVLVLLFALVYLARRLKVFATPFAKLTEITHSIKELAAIGIPAIVTNAIIPVSNGIVVALVAAYGVNATAGFGVAMRIEPLALIAFYALSAVASPFAGQNFAAGRHQRLLEGRRVYLFFCLGLGAVIAIILALVAKPLVGLFSSDPKVTQVATLYLWVVAPSYGIYGLVMAVNASFNGIGSPLPAVAISATRVIFVLLPLIYVSQKWFGLFGIFASIAVANILVGILAFQWYGHRIRRLSPEPLPAG